MTHIDGKAKGQFVEGLELAEDLLLSRTALLYPAGTMLSRSHLEKLIKMREANRRLDFEFLLIWNDPLVRECRLELEFMVREILRKRLKDKFCQSFLAPVEEHLGPVLERLLDDDKLILTLYDKLYSNFGGSTGISPFLEHAGEVLLFSLGIALTQSYGTIIRDNPSRLTDIAAVALLHNLGALGRLEQIIRSPEEERQKVYWEACREGYELWGNLEAGGRIGQSIVHLAGYSQGERGFLGRKEWPAVLANIVLVALSYLQKERGLFGEPQPVRLIIDQLNARVLENYLNETAVRSLTTGLKFRDIFAFYQEMDSLIRECPYKSAVPYPMTGFKSPTIFICRHTVRECPYLDGSRSSVNLVRPQGDLEPGRYHRCNLLTPQLHIFYEKYYEEIKDSNPPD